MMSCPQLNLCHNECVMWSIISEGCLSLSSSLFICSDADSVDKIEVIWVLLVISFVLFKVWTSVPNEGGPVYFLGPAAAEHPQQALLPDDQWSSGSGTEQLLLIIW